MVINSRCLIHSSPQFVIIFWSRYLIFFSVKIQFTKHFFYFFVGMSRYKVLSILNDAFYVISSYLNVHVNFYCDNCISGTKLGLDGGVIPHTLMYSCERGIPH